MGWGIMPQANVILIDGRVVSGPLSRDDFPAATIRRYLDADAAADALRTLVSDWYQAAFDAGQDMTNMQNVNLSALFDDFARILRIPPGEGPKEWPYLPEFTE